MYTLYPLSKPALVLALLTVPCLQAAEPFALDQATLRAQLSPVQFATLSAEMTGKISRLPVHEGQRVKKGSVLVAFDCALQKAQLKKAHTQLKAAHNTLKGNKRMSELNAIGSVELINSELEVHKAEADIEYLDATLDRCVINAPFDGVIGDKLADVHEFIQVGAPLLELLDDSALQLEFIAPSSWLQWLTPGFKFEVRIDDTENTYPAILEYTAAKVDAMSQTVKVVAVIDGSFPELKPGMSGRINITPSNQR